MKRYTKRDREIGKKKKKVSSLLIIETILRERRKKRERERGRLQEINGWKELAGFICKGRHPPDQLPDTETAHTFLLRLAQLPRTEARPDRDRFRQFSPTFFSLFPFIEPSTTLLSLQISFLSFSPTEKRKKGKKKKHLIEIVDTHTHTLILRADRRPAGTAWFDFERLGKIALDYRVTKTEGKP